MDMYDYKKYPAIKNCYLDGRYFNKVLGNYPGLITNPLKIFLSDTAQNKNYVHWFITSYYSNSAVSSQ